MLNACKWLTLPLLTFFACAFAEPPSSQIFTIRSYTNPTKDKQGFSCNLLELALDKSIPEYGPYKIGFSYTMNDKRSFTIAADNSVPNFFFTSGYTEATQFNELIHTEMPILQGVLGYRICFYNKNNAEAVNNIKTIEQLKKLSIGQVWDWPDVSILRNNGFTVVESTSTKNLYPMLEKNRFDLLCRGVNEISREQEKYITSDTIQLEQSFALYYPSPRFYWTNKQNVKAMERINAGIAAAYQDGSLQALFERHYQEPINYTHLHDRKIFTLTAPKDNFLNSDYKKFFIDFKNAY